MPKVTLTTIIALSVLLVAAPGTDSAHGSTPAVLARQSATLGLSHALVTGHVSQVECPAGAPDSTACFQSSSKGVVPGLGATSEQSLLFVEDPDTSCERWHSSPVLTVLGKGEIDLSVRPPGDCVIPTTGILAASLVFTVTGGSGIYAGASGSGTVLARGGPGTTNRYTDTFNGSVTVPGLEFDLTPPVLSGAISKTVLAPRKAKVVRVTYTVTARDEGQGSVPVTCKPHSGSRFKIGRTKVTCSATDSSGNTATKRFAITVKRRR
jgi:hypothetical protein